MARTTKSREVCHLHDLTLRNCILWTPSWVNTKRGKIVEACGTRLVLRF